MHVTYVNRSPVAILAKAEKLAMKMRMSKEDDRRSNILNCYGFYSFDVGIIRIGNKDWRIKISSPTKD